MQSFERLTEIRKQAGLQQKDFAQLLGVAVPTQRNYEKGLSKPDLEYLEKLQELGFDVIYLLTGEKNISTLNTEDSKILNLWHQAPELVRHAALHVLAIGQSPQVANYIADITRSSIMTGGIQQNTQTNDKEKP